MIGPFEHDNLAREVREIVAGAGGIDGSKGRRGLAHNRGGVGKGGSACKRGGSQGGAKGK